MSISWGYGLAAHYQSVMPVGQCPILKQCGQKQRKNLFSFLWAAQFFPAQKLTAIIRKGKTVKIRVLCQKKRKNAEGCHICTLSFSKGVKKRCTCEKYCHKTCIGKCSDV